MKPRQILRVATATVNQTPLCWEQNEANIAAAIEEAKRRNAIVLLLPELAITGYGCEDLFHSTPFVLRAMEVLENLLPKTMGITVGIGLPVRYQNALFNCVAICRDGKILGLLPKKDLVIDGIHYEPRWFKEWQRGVVSNLDGIPIGDLVIEVDGVRMSCETCEEAWTDHRSAGFLARRAVDLILNASASHFALGKHHGPRKNLVLEGSRLAGVGYLYANLLGNEAGRAIYDGAGLIASNGKMLAEARRFSFENLVVTTACIDIQANRDGRVKLHSHHPDLEPDPGLVVYDSGESAETRFATIQEMVRENRGANRLEAWETSEDIRYEEFTRAVGLGLWDYMTKSKSNGFIVSLSGGADSSAVAALSHFAFGLAVNELGHRALEKLKYYDGSPIEIDESPKVFARKMTFALLRTVYQRTVNNSEDTSLSARELAADIGADHTEIIVDDMVDLAQNKIEQILRYALDPKIARHGIALQNIQARGRVNPVWGVANAENRLLLVTSNRNEAVVGYCTMDGDTSGSLNPIGGIDKPFLQNWLKWIEKSGPNGLWAVTGIHRCNGLQPSAELLPLDQQQLDEKDLGPYVVLNAMEACAIGDKVGPWETYQFLLAQFDKGKDSVQSYAPKSLLKWCIRFFELWPRNQWKRERFAVTFHLDDRSLDPKTWFRFPVLNGGFNLELEALRHEIRTLAE